MSKRASIAKLVNNPNTPQATRQKLALAQRIRAFASDELLLPDNKSYTTFVDLKGEPPVWLVVAAPQFSLRPKQWCYWLVGCLTYRGYFKSADAQKAADELRDQEFDVAITPGGAYSTLGWFADPLLSTMTDRSEANLAAFLFHELAHQVLFVKGDTTFNESFATAVERLGLARWLVDQESELAATDKSRQLEKRVIELLLGAREDLARLYDGDRDAASMANRKAERVSELRRSLVSAGAGSYERATINNATLSLVATYEDGVPAFEALLQSCDHRLECFYESAQIKADLPEVERTQWLKNGN